MQLSQAILPVAGLGTRFLPWTKVVAKELLPIGNVPIIALLVDEALGVGITDVCFVISRGKEAIPQYFAHDTELERVLRAKGKMDLIADLARYDSVKFTTVYQDEQLGDGHAVLQAKDWVKSDSLAILFGDDLIAGGKTGLSQMVDAMGAVKETPAVMLCLENVDRESVSQYGIVEAEDAGKGKLKKVTGLVEKPDPTSAPSTLAVVGKYIIPVSTFDTLPGLAAGHGGEIRLIDAFIDQLGSMPIYGVEVEGKRLDTGRPEGYKQAVQMLG